MKVHNDINFFYINREEEEKEERKDRQETEDLR